MKGGGGQKADDSESCIFSVICEGLSLTKRLPRVDKVNQGLHYDYYILSPFSLPL